MTTDGCIDRTASTFAIINITAISTNEISKTQVTSQQPSERRPYGTDYFGNFTIIPVKSVSLLPYNS